VLQCVITTALFCSVSKLGELKSNELRAGRAGARTDRHPPENQAIKANCVPPASLYAGFSDWRWYVDVFTWYSKNLPSAGPAGGVTCTTLL